MSSIDQVYHKSVGERFLYAFLFEVLGIGISAPLAAWLFDHALFEMGVVTVVIAIMALILNMIYNTLFDRMLRRKGWHKTRRIRSMHAIGFELTLLVMTIPFIMWYLNMSMWDALVMDIAFILFYLPYTYLFNLAYDIIRSKVVK